MAPQNLPKSSCVGQVDGYCKLVYLVRELTELCKQIWQYFSHLLIKRYYKSRQSYYKLRERFLQTTTKFSQIVTGVTNYDNIISNYDSYYNWITTDQSQMLGLVFNSIHLSRNFITCRFLFVCFCFCFYFGYVFFTQIKFSLSITSIYTRSKFSGLHLIASKWRIQDGGWFQLNNFIMALLLLSKIIVPAALACSRTPR